MSLTFVDDSDERVDISAASSINNLTTFTHIQWLNPNAQTSSRLWVKEGTDSTNGLKTTTDDNLELDVATDATALYYLTDTAPLTDRVWQLIATTYDEGATPRAHFYRGTLTARCVELTSFATKTEGSGSKIADAAFGMVICNRKPGSGARAMGGEIAMHHFEGRVMSLDEIISWQFHPRVLGDTRLFFHFGFNGTTNIPDWSGKGNVGTISGGPSVGPHVPLGPFFGFGIGGGGGAEPPAPVYVQVGGRFRLDDGVTTEPPVA